jgi:transcriptional regulator with XRE-family HTH domain
LREQLGISQEALADKCSLHRTYVGLIERGERNLSLSTVETLAAGLGVAVAELFTGMEPKPLPRKQPREGGSDMRSLTSHIVAIRTILIEAGLTDARRYDSAYREAQKKP